MQRCTWLWPLIVNMHPAESKRSSRLDAQQILLSFALSSSICIGGAKREQGKRRHCGGRGEGMSPSPGCRRAPRGSRALLHACSSQPASRSHTYIWVHRCMNRREGPHPCFRALWQRHADANECHDECVSCCCCCCCITGLHVCKVPLEFGVLRPFSLSLSLSHVRMD